MISWVAGYERLWRTAGTDRLGELFAPDARYVPAPFEAPLRGLEQIAALWEAERHGHDEGFELRAEPIAVEGDTGVVRLDVRYAPPREQVYRDLWVITLDQHGYCTSFEEWPFWPPETDGGYLRT
jgi:hypothetical protein